MTYLPEHLLPIANPDWGLWKWFVLRAAGFPVEMASRLSDKQCAALAEQALECATFLQNLNREAVLQIDARLAALHREGRGLKDPAFKAALKAKRLAEAGKLHETQARETGILELFRKIEDARAKHQCSLHDFQEAFARSSARQSQILWGVARDGLFQEAVLWQNRHAFETAIQPVAREAQPAVTRNQRQREREQLIASYLQRYCAKNDTIGFFGPVAWFEFHRNGPALAAAPGAALVKTRRVYFEDWAIDCLAESLSSVPGIEAWIPPRLAPYFRLEDGMLHAPGSGGPAAGAGRASALRRSTSSPRNTRAHPAESAFLRRGETGPV